MYLIKNMIRRGLSIDEVLQLIETKQLPVSKDQVLNELKKEENIIQNDEEFKELFKLVKSQSKIDGELFKMNRDYYMDISGFKENYLPLLHMGSSIKENNAVFIFLCNRFQRVNKETFEDYNAGFLREKGRALSRKLKKYELKTSNDKSSNNLVSTIFPKKGNPNIEAVKPQVTHVITPSVSSTRVVPDVKENSDDVEEAFDPEINSIIKNMKTRAKEIKGIEGLLELD